MLDESLFQIDVTLDCGDLSEALVTTARELGQMAFVDFPDRLFFADDEDSLCSLLWVRAGLSRNILVRTVELLSISSPLSGLRWIELESADNKNPFQSCEDVPDEDVFQKINRARREAGKRTLMGFCGKMFTVTVTIKERQLIADLGVL